MADTEVPNTKKYHANPIEFIIFSVISMIFINSVYNLFYEHPGFSLAALVPMKATPISEGRKLASISPTLLTLELDCLKIEDQFTSANKARINGKLCGTPSVLEGTKLTVATIINKSNQFTATVFAQNDSNRFSTDYIPLIPGKNTIHIEFGFSGPGKSFSQDYTIIKN